MNALPAGDERRGSSAAHDDQSRGVRDTGEGTVPGLGAAEVPRRRLTPAEVSEIVRAEAAERDTAAGQYEHTGHPDRAERLRREARILLAALDETR